MSFKVSKGSEEGQQFHLLFQTTQIILPFFTMLYKNKVIKMTEQSAADVKMEIPVLVRSLKSSILSSTSFQMGKTFWGVVKTDPRIPPNKKKDDLIAYRFRIYVASLVRTQSRPFRPLSFVHMDLKGPHINSRQFWTLDQFWNPFWAMNLQAKLLP